MKRTVLLYAAVVAGLAFLLQWLEYRNSIRLLSTDWYVVLVAVVFVGLGVWVGVRIARRERPAEFSRNVEAVTYLGLTERELEVLELLAQGLSNRQMADRLHVSANTVKTHLSRVYDKLDAPRRTAAVEKARSLRIIP